MSVIFFVIVKQCEPGFYGQLCESPCPNGTFGYLCGGLCSPMCSEIECHSIYGCPKHTEADKQRKTTGKSISVKKG